MGEGEYCRGEERRGILCREGYWEEGGSQQGGGRMKKKGKIFSWRKYQEGKGEGEGEERNKKTGSMEGSMDK